jgi:RNA polymerase sigma-70 factor (ECF subfamily)
MEQIATATFDLVHPEAGDPDLPLVEASAGGDAKAFETLIRKYDRKLYRIALNVTHNPEDAEEAVQDAFFKAYRNLDRFRSDARFATWLFRIAVNESLMKLRRQKRAGRMAEDPEGGEQHWEAELVEWSPNPESRYGASEFREILESSLKKLSPALSVVFVLRDIEENSIAETAEILKLTENAVKSRLSRARSALREQLGRYFRKPVLVS